MFCVISLCSVVFFFSGFDSSQKNYLNLFSLLQFGTLQKMLHFSSAFSQCDLSSLSLSLSLFSCILLISKIS